MNIESFKVFCDLCDTGSFSRAAEASGITQSAVSQQIHAVEKRFGVPLIDRSSHPFSLTPEGGVYLEACRDILARFDSLATRFRTARGQLDGKLHLASVISIALYTLPPVLVKAAEAETKSSGGIIIPDSAKEKPQRGTVVAAGPGKKDEPTTVKVGDSILYGKYSGTEIQVDGVDYLIMRESDIFAIL